MSKRLRIPIIDLLPLSYQHDPFYAGAPAQLTKGKWFAEQWQRFQMPHGSHVRRCHYRIVSDKRGSVYWPDGQKYVNTERHSDELELAACYARHLDLVAADAFTDRKNPEPILHAPANWTENTMPGWKIGDFSTWALPAPWWNVLGMVGSPGKLYLELPEAEVTGYAYDRYEQPYFIEVWIEKTTMNDVLLPVCEELHANLVTAIGFNSITGAVNLLRRVKQLPTDKPVRIFYISDFDPGGLCMPVAVARHFEYYRPRYAPNADIKLNPLVMTLDQVIQYDLERIPIKESELRKGNFEHKHGEGAVELDALEAQHPGELAKIVREAIEPYRDPELAEQFDEARQEAEEALKEAWYARTKQLRQRLGEFNGRVGRDVQKFVRKAYLLDQKVKRALAPFRDEAEALAEEMQAAMAPHQPELDSLREAAKICVEGVKAPPTDGEESSQRESESTRGDFRVEPFQPQLPELPEAQIEVPDESQYLFDSGRTYLEQLNFYPSKGLRMKFKTCEHCTRQFRPNKQNQRFCNEKCRCAFNYERKKAAAQPQGGDE
jgi:hypothetical protein